MEDFIDVQQNDECNNGLPVQEVLSSDESSVDDCEDQKAMSNFQASLGLIDEEGIFILPPEDPGEDSDQDDIQARRTDRLISQFYSQLSRKQSSETPFLEGKRCQKNKKKRKKRTLTVNLSNCKYESVRRVVRRFGFREIDEEEDWTLYWTDYSVSLERVVVMKSWQKINHFPGMSEICRKDSLARNLNRMAKLFPKDYNIFPKSWCLPSEWNDFQTYARKHKNRTYIVKPDTGCQGRGIFITRTAKDVRPIENIICQVYISKPFLIDGYKFDMRLYVLITSCDPLRIFVFKDGLARFTTCPYVEPHQRNLHDMYMHLTNYAVQKHSVSYIKDDEEGGTKRRITTINRWFTENGYDLKKIWSDIDDVVIKTILSGYSVIKHNYRTCFPNHVQSSACFEILGFDIMLSHKLKPYVLEVNHSPSFNTDSRLDKEIKENMIWDTLQLAHFGSISKKKCIEEERKRIRNRLLQKAAKKDHRDALEKEIAKYQAQNEKYEESHLGNYRLIYPGKDADKYAQFLNPNASFYQETMTYKVRSECARQMREEIRVKQEKLEILMNRNKTTGPESPGPRKVLSKTGFAHSYIPRNRSEASDVIRESKKRRTVTSMSEQNWECHGPDLPGSRGDDNETELIREKSVDRFDVAIDLTKPQPILEHEEADRIAQMKRRETIMRQIGLIEMIHQVLDNTPGVCSIVSSSAKRTSNKTDSKPEFQKTESNLEQTKSDETNLFQKSKQSTTMKYERWSKSQDQKKEMTIRNRMINMASSTVQWNDQKFMKDVNKDIFYQNERDFNFRFLLPSTLMHQNKIQAGSLSNIGACTDYIQPDYPQSPSVNYRQPHLLRNHFALSNQHYLHEKERLISIQNTQNRKLINNDEVIDGDIRSSRMKNGFLPSRNFKSTSVLRTKHWVNDSNSTTKRQSNKEPLSMTESKMNIQSQYAIKPSYKETLPLPAITNLNSRAQSRMSEFTTYDNNLLNPNILGLAPSITSLKLNRYERRSANQEGRSAIIFRASSSIGSVYPTSSTGIFADNQMIAVYPHNTSDCSNHSQEVGGSNEHNSRHNNN